VLRKVFGPEKEEVSEQFRMLHIRKNFVSWHTVLQTPPGKISTLSACSVYLDVLEESTTETLCTLYC
jgi:hypothetical protein